MVYRPELLALQMFFGGNKAENNNLHPSQLKQEAPAAVEAQIMQATRACCQLLSRRSRPRHH